MKFLNHTGDLCTTSTANLGDYAASWVPQPIKDTVDSWSTRKKVAVASAIIASLAAIYNREAIMNLVKDMLDVEPQRKIFHNTDNMIYKLRDLKQYLTPYLNPLSNSFDEKEAQALARDLSSINPSVLLEDLETTVKKPTSIPTKIEKEALIDNHIQQILEWAQTEKKNSVKKNLTRKKILLPSLIPPKKMTK